ncbi:hypothetical protein CERZMDRAFT_109831 [Cercospora zeae-maydis SCOH1-5]|uniref:PCI domain-containing protein n=1 Tax=Cercospora zeae-maydis SCOH1-5 TaxID=717836 RepID=A0A6A6FRI4_9PEZI|nr:hypothetical protein CERZMDRAFT_109831 [Cercospora zeae-maydis SCOH1-5]
MDQTRAINALAPFVALAKSANSPRAAADLVQQATSAPNTYVFAELLQQPNIRQLVDHEQFAPALTLLQTFAWGTWETYKSTSALPALSDAQALKLRLLSLLSLAAEKGNASTLSYASLCSRLDLSSTVDLEHLVTQAIYSNLITATLNPAAQTVVITSVAPLRDVAPGSVQNMISELAAWSGRCDAVLEQLEEEIQKVKADAEKRAKRESKAEKQIKAVTEQAEKASVIKETRMKSMTMPWMLTMEVEPPEAERRARVSWAS